MNQLRTLQQASSMRRHIPVVASYTHLHAKRQPTNPLFLSGLNAQAQTQRQQYSNGQHAAKQDSNVFSEPSLLSFLDPPSPRESSKTEAAEYIIADSTNQHDQAVFKQVAGDKPKTNPIFSDESVVVDGDA